MKKFFLLLLALPILASAAVTIPWANITNKPTNLGALTSFATGLPSNGSGTDGDIYYRTDSPYGVYKRVSGAWVLQQTFALSSDSRFTAINTATQTALNGKAALPAVAALGSNALTLGPREWAVKTATFSTNQTFTYTGGSNSAMDGLVIIAKVTSPITITVTPTSSTVYRNGSNTALSAAFNVPVGTQRLTWWTPDNGTTLYLEDTVVSASDVPWSITSTNYTPTSADVGGHLAGIDTKLGTLSSGGSGSAIGPGTITQAAHGFVVGDVVYNNGGTWAKARADAVATVAAHYFVSARTTNTFVPVAEGKVDVTSLGYTAGAYYYLSDVTAGLLSTTGPTAPGSWTVPVLYVESSTVGYVNPAVPMANGPAWVTKTANYTLTKADALLIFNSGSAVTATLYNATMTDAQVHTIKNIGAGTLTVDATSLGQIDGNNTVALLQGDCIDIFSNGTGWFIK